MKHLAKLFFCVLTFSVLNVAAATTKPVSGNKGKNAIEFVKAEGNELIFKTDLQNLPENGCLLLIKDLDGNTLFLENIKTTVHQKLYRINRDTMNGLNFEVRSKNFNFKESFDFKTKVQETLLVTKL